MSLMLAMALAAAQPDATQLAPIANENGVAVAKSETPDSDSDKVDEAALLIKAGKPADAIPILEGVIARMEARNADEKRQVFAARSLTETILYSAMSTKLKKDVIVLDDTWATAYFLKGFALIDLNRSDEAKEPFDKALELSPMNAQFRAERGEWYKSRKDWANAFSDFEAASSAAEFSPENVKNTDKARALRGMGFVRIEQGQLDEAEKLFHQSLKLEPGNQGALGELEYIKSLRSN